MFLLKKGVRPPGGTPQEKKTDKLINNIYINILILNLKILNINIEN